MKKSNRGGFRPNSGRKKRVGTEPMRNTTVFVECSVIVKCREMHGSLANALRYAANAFSGTDHVQPSQTEI